MSETLHLDLESRSTVDLRRTGVYVYAKHETTDLWCACYAFGESEIQTWRPGDPCPSEIADHVLSGGIIIAHNAAFERVMWKHILTPRYGWPEPATEQWRCTMILSYAMALPGALKDVAPAVGLAEQKDATGHRLMLQMARPRKIQDDKAFQALCAWAAFSRRKCGASTADWWANEAAHVKDEFEKIITWWDTPEKIERLLAYCRQDVATERDLEKCLRPLKDSELALWHLDQTINDRGVRVDVPLCNAAKSIVEETAEKLNAEMRDVTDKAVTACSNRNQIIAFLRTQGTEVDSIAKDKVEAILARKDISIKVRRVLNLRRESAKASVAKIDALLRGMCPDGRARGMLQFHAASTGRWAGRRFQPQNIKRPERKDTDTVIDYVMSGSADLVEMAYGEPLSAVGDTLRGMIKGNIIAADYSNIEGRTLAWLAGETWKIKAFKDYDRGIGADLYLLTASEITGIPIEKLNAKSPERQSHGKVPELALGYQGGVGAFQTMAVNYGVDLTDEEVEDIRDRWRKKNSKIKAFWGALEDAAEAAVRNPGSTHYAGDHILFRVAGSFLFMRLPSKRFLAYAYPKMMMKEMPWYDDNNLYAKQWEGTVEEAEEKYGKAYAGFDQDSGQLLLKRKAKKMSVSYMGVNSYTRKWERCFGYGGLIAENAASGTARDVMADAMPRLEAAGYPIILSIHDEIVADVKKGHGSAAEMCEIMSVLSGWAKGLPVSVEGFEGPRYRK